MVATIVDDFSVLRGSKHALDARAQVGVHAHGQRLDEAAQVARRRPPCTGSIPTARRYPGPGSRRHKCPATPACLAASMSVCVSPTYTARERGMANCVIASSSMRGDGLRRDVADAAVSVEKITSSMWAPLASCSSSLRRSWIPPAHVLRAALADARLVCDDAHCPAGIIGKLEGLCGSGIG